MRTIVWFSCGAASAVAAKLAVQQRSNVVVAYCNTAVSEHPDNMRFKADVERWIDHEIITLSSSKYAHIDDVFERTRYMAGIAGARCTTELKKLVREEYQLPTDTHVFGYTSDESKRAAKFEEKNPALAVDWILIENGVDKDACLTMLDAAGIARPTMYGLGFAHNNCIGCVKATSPGYWNRTRQLFPDVFERRARQSRTIGARLVRIKGKRMFLDELPSDADAPDDDIDCGPTCQSPDFREESD